MIYNKEPIDVLYDIVKPLANQIPDIFKNSMTEDENDIPESYILLRAEISDTTVVYGDGKSKIRSADCDIVLVSKGTAPNSDSLHNVNRSVIKKHLLEQGISYSGNNLGYDSNHKNTQYVFSLKVNYCV